MRFWPNLAVPLLAAGLAVVACESEEITVIPTCTPDAPAASPSEAAPGDQVVLTSSPLTDAWDTIVTVGGARADVVALDRTDCDDCDDCMDTAGCDACATECEDCAETCAACVETVTIVVPDRPPGTYDVQLVNRHGVSALGTLTVLAGAVDTGVSDTGTTDTGTTDTGTTDTGTTDTGTSDSGSTDTGTSDTAVD